MALDHRWATRPTAASPTPATSPTVAIAEQPPEGTILLPSGTLKIPAKTKSGYCLKTPQDYVATGDESYPAITDALPRCEDVKQMKQVVWQPLH
jgi:hypothetical protein